MTHVRYTMTADPDVESLLDRFLPDVSAEIGALQLPKLRAVVLGGGYGRGEGGVLHTSEGGRLYNDLDFFVFTENADAGEAARINRELKKISERGESRLGIAVDFGPAKNISALKAVSHTLMYQELLRGWLPVWGQADLGAWIEPLEAADIPYSEAVRLLLNRGMGLLFAGEYLKNGRNDPDFIVRNMNKAYLGGGDALLIASGKYCWRGPDRVDAYRELARTQKLSDEFSVLYEKAFRWKLEPEVKLPDDPAAAWQRCRKFYLDSAALCSGQEPGAAAADVIAGLRCRAAGERSLKNGLRWLIRGHALRSPLAAFDPPVVTVLEMVFSLLSGHDGYADLPDRLRTLWGVFN
jgi:hypothetical protein